MLHHMLRRVAQSAAVPVATYIAAKHSATSLTTHTFTGASIGTAAADRLVVVCVSSQTSSNRTISSATIGGNAATIVVSSANGINPGGIICLPVAAGTTADIVIKFSAGVSNCRIQVFTITGLNSTTAVSSNQGSGLTTAPSCAITPTAGAAVIANAFNQSSTAGSVTVTSGGTATNDDTISTYHYYAGLRQNTPAGSLTCTITFPASANSRIFAAAWR